MAGRLADWTQHAAGTEAATGQVPENKTGYVTQTNNHFIVRSVEERNQEGLQIRPNFLRSLNWVITVRKLRMKNHDNHRFIFPKMEYLYHCLRSSSSVSESD